MQLRILLILMLSCLAPAMAGAQSAASQGKEDQLYPVPRFRHIDADAKSPKINTARQLIFIADEDFPPFSYADITGKPKGLSVDVALALCSSLKIQCTVRLLKWEDLASSLAKGEGDAVISGLKLDDRALATFAATRPLYRTLGRFAVRNQNPITAPSIRLLAGKRIGVAKESAHEAWLKRYFSHSQIVPHASLAEAQEALRGAKVDALFGDALNLVYWTEGEASKSCCRLVPGAFVDEDYFSRSFVFFVRRGDTELKRALDYGLDRLQESGDWEKIFRAYVPASPW